MIVVLKKGTTGEQLEELVRRIEADGLKPKINRGETKTVVDLIGNTAEKNMEPYQALPFVETVFRVQDKVYRKISRVNGETPAIVKVDGIEIGGDKLTMMIGPCALEGETQIRDAVELVNKLKVEYSGDNIAGVVMRGGAYKPRTTPDTFQGQKKEGLTLFSQIAHSHGIPIVTEVVDPRDVDFVSQYADILQIGARNSQNYPLLEEVGRATKPVLLKRAMGGSIDELMGSGDYVVKHGNESLILCLRGVKGAQDNAFRNNVDLADILYLKNKARVPVIFDPSHSTGKRDYVIPVSELAVVAGVDGLLADVHPYPEVALVDAAQQLTPNMAIQLIQAVNYYRGAVRMKPRS